MILDDLTPTSPDGGEDVSIPVQLNHGIHQPSAYKKMLERVKGPLEVTSRKPGIRDKVVTEAVGQPHGLSGHTHLHTNNCRPNLSPPPTDHKNKHDLRGRNSENYRARRQ